MPAKLAAPFAAVTLAQLQVEVLGDFVQILKPQGEDKEYVYHDTRTEREFYVRVSMGTVGGSDKVVERFFVEELTPNGRMVKESDVNSETAYTEPRILELESKEGPNMLSHALRGAHINPDLMIFVGGGYSVGSIYHASLKDCAVAIAEVLGNNTRYVCYREETEQEKARSARRAEEGRHSYYQAEKASLERAQELPGIFKGMYSMVGPLTEEKRKAILSYLNAPGQEAWNDLRSTAITGHGTLWQAWTKYDPSAPRLGSVGFPDRATLEAAMAFAVKHHEDAVNARLAETSPHGLRVVK